MSLPRYASIATELARRDELLTRGRIQIRVLQQMTQLIMINPERLREKTEEQKDTDQTNWVRQHGGPAGDCLRTVDR
jgi:hypothetical protein